MKIIFFGDSLTQGTFGASYVDKVAAAVRGHHFINQGVNGDTSLNLFRRLDKDVLADKPDGIFIMIGVNDAVSAVESGSHLYFRFMKKLPRGQVSPISFRENMRALLGKLVAAQIKTWVALPPIEYNPATVTTLRQMNEYTSVICREFNIPVLDLMAAMTPKEVPARNAVGLSQYSQNLLIRLGLDTNYEKHRAAGSFSYSFDGTHLTENGAQQMADLIVPFLRTNGLR
ncbi:MAG: GDSL-type esterase/lipase family protein [Chloroflexota bacterium]